MMFENKDVSEWDGLVIAWERAKLAANTAQEERDAKFRLFLVGLDEPASIDLADSLTDSLNELWRLEAEKRDALETFIKHHMSNHYDVPDFIPDNRLFADQHGSRVLDSTLS